mgnify:CR=1 FL=1|tara:strand:- start:781 stop:2535 length:1755 start_codon:yes stop_codon:yes gene_type:complete
MKNLENIAEDLFNKIRGRFPSVTIGDESGQVTNIPEQARFFDFDYKEGERTLGKVSVSVDEDSLSVMYSENFVANEDTMTQNNWYNFLKELRQFSKKRMLNFDTRNITKSNLNKRDYKFLASNRAGEEQMTESTMYGTNKTSFQKIGNARLSIKHTEAINTESAAARSQKIGKIYIESPEGEKFKYPFKHLSGARAMARHVSEGGNPYDDFGTHIVGLSEEMNKLRKFKNYMGRSSVMAESLAGYVDVVKERISTVKKTIESLQKPKFYAEAIGSFEKPMMEDVPSDIAENWVDQLTIKQFNEELADVFPYIYKLVSEATKAKELGPEELGEGFFGRLTANSIEDWAEEYPKGVLGDASRAFLRMRQQNQGNEWAAQVECRIKSFEDFVSVKERMPQGPNGQPLMPQEPRAWLEVNGNHKCASAGQSENVNTRIDKMFDSLMGQFGESEECKECNCAPCECNTDEGNAYVQAVQQAKMNGNKKGDKIDGPDGDEITLEKEQKIPLGEFILSYFDYTTGEFPKGETAILTMVEKDYGEHFITPAKRFLEKINTRVSEVMGYREPEITAVEQDNTELNSIRSLAGL